MVPMAAIGLFLVEYESVDALEPGMPEGSKDWHIPRGPASPPRGDWQRRMFLTFQRAVAPGVGVGVQIGSRKTTHGGLPLSQIASWADSVCGWPVLVGSDRQHHRTRALYSHNDFIHSLA